MSAVRLSTPASAGEAASTVRYNHRQGAATSMFITRLWRRVRRRPVPDARRLSPLWRRGRRRPEPAPMVPLERMEREIAADPEREREIREHAQAERLRADLAAADDLRA